MKQVPEVEHAVHTAIIFVHPPEVNMELVIEADPMAIIVVIEADRTGIDVGMEADIEIGIN